MFTGNIMIQAIDEVLAKNGCGLPQLITNIADALKTAIRMGSKVSVPGVMHVSEAHIEIQWAWITLPPFMYMLAACFVGTAAW